MKVHSVRPFLVTRSMLIMWFLADNRKKISEKIPNGDFICFGKPAASLTKDVDSKKILESRGSSVGLCTERDIEGFEESDSLFADFKCQHFKLAHSRLTKLTPPLAALFKHSDTLTINHNQLDFLDESMIASCTSLRDLEMFRTCSPDTKFTLAFLAPLTQLTDLVITLPEGPADFGAFQDLKLLRRLSLHGVSSIDATKKRTKLSRDSFHQLSRLPALEALDLSFFQITTLENNMFVGFTKLTNLKLTDNRIARIQYDTFNKCPSKLVFLDLSDNQLSDLHPNLFNKLKYLNNLNIRHNRLRTLSPGCFSGLESLNSLNLSQNQIEDLPIGMFDGLRQLQTLDLSNNKISRIQSGVFKEQSSLCELILNHNPISTIEPDSFQCQCGLIRFCWTIVILNRSIINGSRG